LEEKDYLEQIKSIRKHLKEHLNEERYEHSLSVSFTSIALAMAHGCDLREAELAGLTHDCAKFMGKKDLLNACEREHIPLLPEYIAAPQVLHGIYGATYARKHFQIENEDILSAIYYHTIGKPAMSLLEKIIYLADYIEVRRGEREELEEIRRIAFYDLDTAVYKTLQATIQYVEKKGQAMCSLSLEALQYYRDLLEKGEDVQ
jgi:putative HD superfamily hydrolase of NAD metabolism